MIRPVALGVVCGALAACRDPNPAYLVAGAEDAGGLDAARDVAGDAAGDAAPADRPPGPGPDLGPDRASERAPSCPDEWAAPGHSFRQRLTIDPGGTALPGTTWAAVTFDHAALVRAGRARADGGDVQVVHRDGAQTRVLPRYLDPRSTWNAGDTRLWFKVGAALAAGTPSTSHALYFGRPAAMLASEPPPAAILRRVLTGTARSDGHGVTTVTLPEPVRPDRSALLFQTRHASPRPVGAVLQGQLASATTLEFRRQTDEPTPAPIDVRWYVAEFAGGVRVQRGSATLSGPTVSVPLGTPVAMERAFVTMSKSARLGDYYWSADDHVLADLAAPGTLQLRSHGGNGHAVSWQVVEFTGAGDATVLRGAAALNGGATSTSAPLSRPVAASRAFVLTSFRTSGMGVDIGARMIRAELASPTAVRIERGLAGDADDLYDIAWQVVELGEPTLVLSGRAELPPGVAAARVPLAARVDPGRTLALASGQLGGGQSTGTTSLASDDVPGVCSATLAVTATELVVERSHVRAECRLSWFVVQFPRTATAVASGTVEACSP